MTDSRPAASRVVRALAVLLNPSMDPSASVSSLVLEEVRRKRGWESLTISNLLDIPTRNSKELALVAATPEPWLASRATLSHSLANATDVVFGWGVSTLSGPARRLQTDQIAWVLDRTEQLGHKEAWMAMGQPRHPSRWRQLVGPQRGLIAGGTTIDRINTMLALYPVAVAAPGDQRAAGISSTAAAASKPGLPS